MAVIARRMMEATGNIFAVADSMGHADIQSMKPYQHHRLDPLREAIDRRNTANRFVPAATAPFEQRDR